MILLCKTKCFINGLCHEVVLGNISIFLISKYRISILIVFIVFMYATHEVYSLDMSTTYIELSNKTKISDKYLFLPYS